jgi:hypothetical protein
MGEDGMDAAPGDAGSVGMAQAAAEAAMDAAGGSADLGGFTPQDINVALGYDITPQSMMDLMGVTAGTVTAPTLNVLMNAGYGDVVGLNPNNPTQSVAEMLAAQNVANNLPMVFNFMVPGLGTAMNVAKNAVESFGGLQSGSMTPGQALGNLGLSAFGFGNSAFNQGPAIGSMSTGQAATAIGLNALANQLGIPGGAPVLGNVLEGQFGPAAGGLAAALTNQALGQTIGLGPLGGLVAQASGIPGMVGGAVAGAVPSAPQGTGLLSAAANMFGQGSAAPSTGANAATSFGTPNDGYYESLGVAPPATTPAPIQAPKLEETSPVIQQLLYGTQRGAYGPLFKYDIGD